MPLGMKNLTYQLWLLAICMLSLTGCSRDGVENIESSDHIAVDAPVVYSSIEVEIMDRVNAYRAEKELNALESLDEISRQAKTHNVHMIEHEEVCHDNFSDRYAALVESIGARAVSENVAYGYHTAEAVVQAWISSEGHRKNMEGNLTHFGISVKEDADGELYFTNIFVRK